MTIMNRVHVTIFKTQLAFLNTRYTVQTTLADRREAKKEADYEKMIAASQEKIGPYQPSYTAV